MSASTSLIGFINFLAFLLSIPIVGGGIWLSSKANTSDCMRFLQWPFIIIGVSIMVISLAGFAGACYRNSYLIRFYLFSMFFVVVALIGFIIFALSVTNKGSGRTVLGRSYLDYYLVDYSGWLEERVANETYWVKISSCVRDSKVCGRMRKEYGGVPESADMFYSRHLNPIESGCCKPPTECNYQYSNETLWNPPLVGIVGSYIDCSRWSNDQQQLCYACDSCKAGVVDSLKKSWRKISLINIVILIALVIVYVTGWAAYRNSRRMDNNEPYGVNRMTKARPARIQL